MAATNLSPVSSYLAKPTPLPLNQPHSHISLPSKVLPKSSFPHKPCLSHYPTSSHTHKTPLSSSSKNPLSDFFPSKKQCPEDHSLDFADVDKPHEECGVVGIFGDLEASRLCYLALHMLQHRGQEGAGIVAIKDNVLQSVRRMGLVSEVFNESKLDHLPGDLAIGDVQYSTAGSSMLKNVQPFVAGYRFGSVGVAHNGNLVSQALRLTAQATSNGFIPHVMTVPSRGFSKNKKKNKK